MNLLEFCKVTPDATWQSITPECVGAYHRGSELWMAPLHYHSVTDLDEVCEQPQCNIIVIPTGSLVNNSHATWLVPAGTIDGGIFGILTNYVKFDHDITLCLYYNN